MYQNFQEIIGYSLFFPTWIKFISLSLVGTDNDMWNTVQNNKHKEENLKMKKWKNIRTPSITKKCESKQLNKVHATELSDENGTIFFFFYDLNGSMYKNEPTM